MVIGDYRLPAMLVILLISSLSSLKVSKVLYKFINSASTLITLLLVLSILPDVWGGRIIPYEILGLNFSIDAFSYIALVPVSVLAFLSAVYSAAEIPIQDRHVRRYHVLFPLLISLLICTVTVRNVFFLFIFVEMITMVAVILVSHREDAKAVEAGLKYLFITSACGAVAIIGLSIMHAHSGSFEFVDIYQASLTGTWDGIQVKICLVSLLIGFGVKAGIFPLHFFIPDAYGEAPSPVSALMHITLPGNYSTIRTISLIAPLLATEDFNVVITLGMITMFVGSLMAFASREIKRMIAYACVETSGFVIFTLGFGSYLGMMAAVFCLMIFPITEGLLFYSGGSVMHQTEQRDIFKLGGLSGKMPVTAIGFIVGGLTMVGVPPLIGFYGKYAICNAAVTVGYVPLAFLVLIASMIALGYYLRSFHSIFLGPRPEHLEKVQEAPAAITLVIVISIATCLIVSFTPWVIFHLVDLAVKSLGMI